MASRLANFNRADVTYKTVNDHPIKTAVLTPKTNIANGGKRPVIVHFHGGCLINGDKIFEPWIAVWLLQLAESKGAIFVSPDYRLLPEATGTDILEDISSFWEWVGKDLSAELAKIDDSISADLSSILVAGESAGGYLAVQSGLLFPSANISAVISQYGMLDMKHPHLSQAAEKHFLGTPATPVSIVDDYLKSVQPGAIRTSSAPPELMGFVVAAIRHGRYLDFLGNATKLFPMETLDTAVKVPPTWILHGNDDTAVVPDISSNFVKKMKEVKPDVPLLFTTQPGEHGFDADVSLDEGWVKEGVAFVENYWPGSI